MNKKIYEPPVIKKVKLEVKNAVLSVCHSSMVGDDRDAIGGCRVTAACVSGAPIP